MPYISQSFIDDLPNQIDIVDLISKRLSLKKTGSDYRHLALFMAVKIVTLLLVVTSNFITVLSVVRAVARLVLYKNTIT